MATYKIYNPDNLTKTDTTTTSASVSKPSKKRYYTACQRCRARRTKCNDSPDPCEHCIKAKVVCEKSSKKVKTKRSAAERLTRKLADRIEWLEAVVKSNGIDVTRSGSFSGSESFADDSSTLMDAGMPIELPTPESTKVDEFSLIEDSVNLFEYTMIDEEQELMLCSALLKLKSPVTIRRLKYTSMATYQELTKAIGHSGPAHITDFYPESEPSDSFVVRGLHHLPSQEDVHLLLTAFMQECIWVPIVTPTEMTEIVHEIYTDNLGATPNSLFIFHMAMAIGSSVLKRADHSAYFFRALYHLQQQPGIEDLEHIPPRDAIAITWYARMESPEGWSVMYCLRNTVSSVLEMGMHKEEFYADKAEDQVQPLRRYFWALVALANHLSRSLLLEVGLEGQEITAKLFDSEDEQISAHSYLAASAWNLEISRHVMKSALISSRLLQEPVDTDVAVNEMVDRFHAEIDQWRNDLKPLAGSLPARIRIELELESLGNILMLIRRYIVDGEAQLSLSTSASGIVTASQWIRNLGVLHQRQVPLPKTTSHGLYRAALTLIMSFCVCEQSGLRIFTKVSVLSDLDCCLQSLESLADRGVVEAIEMMEFIRKASDWLKRETDVTRVLTTKPATEA